MKSMEEMLKAAQQAAETIQKQMNDAQVTLDIRSRSKALRAADW